MLHLRGLRWKMELLRLPYLPFSLDPLTKLDSAVNQIFFPCCKVYIRIIQLFFSGRKSSVLL